jgi:hypothetical protein
VLDEFVDLLESAFVEQQFDAFSDGEFAFGVLPFAAFHASAFVGGLMAAPEFFETIHVP